MFFVHYLLALEGHFCCLEDQFAPNLIMLKVNCVQHALDVTSKVCMLHEPGP
jgi:hypothetical protein